MSIQYRQVCTCGYNTSQWYDRREDAERDWKLFHYIEKVKEDAGAVGRHHFCPEKRQGGDAGADVDE